MESLNFSKNLLKLRKERKITQENLANYLGVTKSAVSKWELNQSYPDITLLPIIASYFDEKGFDYAYTYPGINKILQCAGRVIRTEEDKGSILLVDNRYLSKKYKDMLPTAWQIESW